MLWVCVAWGQRVCVSDAFGLEVDSVLGEADNAFCVVELSRGRFLAL